MNLRRTRMQVVRIDAPCGACEHGVLVCKQQVEVQVGLYVKRPGYVHACDSCGASATLDAAYPQQAIEPALDMVEG